MAQEEMRTFELIRDGCGGKLKVYRGKRYGKREIACYYLTSVELDSLEEAIKKQ